MSTVEAADLLVERDGAVARVTLNRPERRNALSLELMRHLLGELREIGADPSVRVVVLGGSGPVFSAGHDLAEMRDRDEAFYTELFDVCTELMEAIHRLPQPVIARVHGVATAAGCQLVATCDLAVAVEEAWFATPGVKIGLFCSTPMVPLSRAVGRKRALEMLLTGSPVPAARALEWGLVNRVVRADQLDATVDELVQAIVAASPLTVGIGKETFWEQIERDEHGAYEVARAAMVQNALAADAQEGMCAFVEKRKPEWRGA